MNNFENKVFKWFGLGLLVTFITAYLVSTNMYLMSVVFSGFTPFIIMILELVFAVMLSVRIHRMEKRTASMLYLGYTILTGLTFSSIFVLYELTSIIWVFLVSSIVFLLFAFIGKVVKVNLSGLGLFLVVGLLGVIILSLINIFIASGTLDMTLCILSLLIFMGFVAYDMQRIKNSNYIDDNMAIICAFNIYLDFINIFIELLRLFGKSRD